MAQCTTEMLGIAGRSRAILKRALVRRGLYPSIHSSCMPFKSYELKTLLRTARFTGSERVLDLGCGVGTQTLIVGARCASVVGVDVSAPAIAQAQAMAQHFDGLVDASFRCSPLEEAEIADRSMDKVLSFCVLEHIPNFRRVLGEILRILRPGGDLVLSADSLETISDAGLIEKHRAENSVERYFSAPELGAELAATGFEQIEVRSIFRSEFARRTFAEGIRRGFRYSYWSAFMHYQRLRVHEALTSAHKPGIFLVARCVRPR